MIRCWVCGAKAQRTKILTKYSDYNSLSPKYRCYCTECLKRVREEEKQDEIEYVRLKKKIMFNSAVEKLESQNIDMYRLKPAIDKVKAYIENNPDKADSSYEIITAIVLINAGVVFQMQKKILNYQVDFYIPSHKVILEIDGERHKSRKGYDKARDEQIIDAVGYDWNLVRIGTEHLDKKAVNLVKAIDGILQMRREQMPEIVL